jgi:hypothetical protein
VNRLHELLKILDDQGGPIRLTELTSRLELSESAVRVLLHRLSAHGLVRNAGKGLYRRTDVAAGPLSYHPDLRAGPGLEAAFTVRSGLAAVVTTESDVALLLPGMVWPGLGAFTGAQLDQLRPAEIHLHHPGTEVETCDAPTDSSGWVASVLLQVAMQPIKSQDRITNLVGLLGFLPAPILMSSCGTRTPIAYCAALYRARRSLIPATTHA